jgi:hypothetical protein
VGALKVLVALFDASEPIAASDAGIDYDNEHRCAEHEHGAQTDGTPEPWDATERRWCAFPQNHRQLPPPAAPDRSGETLVLSAAVLVLVLVIGTGLDDCAVLR